MRIHFIIGSFLVLLLLCGAAFAACNNAQSANGKTCSGNCGNSQFSTGSSGCGAKFFEANWKNSSPSVTMTCPMKAQGCGGVQGNCGMKTNCTNGNTGNCGAKFTPKSGCPCKK